MPLNNTVLNYCRFKELQLQEFYILNLLPVFFHLSNLIETLYHILCFMAYGRWGMSSQKFSAFPIMLMHMESWNHGDSLSSRLASVSVLLFHHRTMNELNHSPSPLFFFLKKNYFICLVKYIPFYALPLNVQFWNFNYLSIFAFTYLAPELCFILPINQCVL